MYFGRIIISLQVIQQTLMNTILAYNFSRHPRDLYESYHSLFLSFCILSDLPEENAMAFRQPNAVLVIAPVI